MTLSTRSLASHGHAWLSAQAKSFPASLLTVKLCCRIPAGTTATATFLAKADGVLAGLAIADAVFAACDPSIAIAWTKQDGSLVTIREEFGTVKGDAAAILRAERVALNFMQVSSCSDASTDDGPNLSILYVALP